MVSARLTLLFDGLEEMLVSAKAIFAVNGVFEEEGLERLQGESHVAPKENEEAEAS